eukprot:CAMPEP_0119317484 /NCGR_PEP_ID=MMETSP1333-20130426/43277_1 /TAXON_ID=418940 /ORGANISM="Scyphosphaera apsteinii, Strain RCC1455" /LENGTH=249 /DNA_ID=CAMNT_0007323421 /DNA_START=160 /DNA_END=909 /DNA_ORIENTATION=-
MSRIVAPGQRAILHLYDSSSLHVFRQAQSYCNSTFGQVVIDDVAAKQRVFRLCGIGSRCRILASAPSMHTDKFGGMSSSVLAEVIGIGIIEPEVVLQHEPFLTVSCADNDALLLPTNECLNEPDVLGTNLSSQWEDSLTEAANLCQRLERVASPSRTHAQTDEWPAARCIERVLEIRSGDYCDTGKLRLVALACTTHLPGTKRFAAMALAQQGRSAELLHFVEEALQEETRRRLAMKALAGLSSESENE